MMRAQDSLHLPPVPADARPNPNPRIGNYPPIPTGHDLIRAFPTTAPPPPLEPSTRYFQDSERAFLSSSAGERRRRPDQPHPDEREPPIHLPPLSKLSRGPIFPYPPSQPSPLATARSQTPQPFHSRPLDESTRRLPSPTGSTRSSSSYAPYPASPTAYTRTHASPPSSRPSTSTTTSSSTSTSASASLGLVPGQIPVLPKPPSVVGTARASHHYPSPYPDQIQMPPPGPGPTRNRRVRANTRGD